jgi:hypothetical protein
VTRDLGAEGGYVTATAIVPGRAGDFANFVRERWPAAGYVLGRGDAEEHEAEGTFGRPPLIGQFKANDLECPQPMATVTLRISVTASPSP